MLAIYTPYTDADGAEYLTSDEVEILIDQVYSRGYLPRRVRRVEGDLGLVISFSWCRELATGILEKVTRRLPPGSLDIHGIRKHGRHCDNQPSGIMGKTIRPNQMVDGLLTMFFQTMVEMISCGLDTEVSLPPERGAVWSRAWNQKTPQLPESLSNPKIAQTTCILNVGELGISTTFNTEDMFGSIMNIPAHWAQSPAVISYLLLIPRLWSLFYRTPRILGRLTTVGKRRFGTPLTELLAVAGNGRATCLWGTMAKRLMLPFWLSTFGKGEFWFFTYLLIYHALSLAEEGDGVPDFGGCLRHAQYIDGFISWCRWYSREGKQPTWIAQLANYLRNDGLQATLNFGTLYRNT